MGFFSIVMIITTLVLLAFLHIRPILPIQLLCNAPQRLQDVLRTDKPNNLGVIVDKTQAYTQNDDSTLQYDTAVASTVTVKMSESVPEVESNNYALVNIYQDDEGPSFLRAIFRSGWISYIIGLTALLSLDITGSLTYITLFSGIAIILGGVLFKIDKNFPK